jgi:hypothetical protein
MIELSQIEEMFESVRAQTDWDVDADMLWGYFFTDPDTAKLEAVAEELESMGFRPVSIGPSEDETHYSLHVEREERHTPASLYVLSQRLSEVAERHGLRSYDGVDVGPVDAGDPEMDVEVSPQVKEDIELLLNELMPLAEERLAQNREFYPFAAAVDAKGELLRTQAWTGDEEPSASDLVDSLVATFQQQAEGEEIRAAAILIDCLTVPPGETEKVDAVAARLDHLDGYSAVVFFPYTIAPDGAVTFAEPFAHEGDDEIFGEWEEDEEDEDDESEDEILKQ